MIAEENDYHQCKISPNNFCYVCGQYILEYQGKNISEAVREAYTLYFRIAVYQDEPWIPKLFCIPCYATLLAWLGGLEKFMPFSFPTLWNEPTNHNDDCYFCLTDIKKSSQKTKLHVEYPEVDSVLKPILRSESMPPPLPPNKSQTVEMDMPRKENINSDDMKVDNQDPVLPSHSTTRYHPHLIGQQEFNNLIQDLHLSSRKATLLRSKLQEWDFLAEDDGQQYAQCDSKKKKLLHFVSFRKKFSS